ncbi:MAG: hypothetical protein ACRDTS_04895 [Mycobacterium sp.]
MLGHQPWWGYTRDAAVDTANKDHRAIVDVRDAIDAMADAAAHAMNHTVIPNLGAEGREGVRA